MRNTWAKFYTEWGSLMMAVSNVVANWARRSYIRSYNLYAAEATELMETIQFSDQPDTDGKAWDFGVQLPEDEPMWPVILEMADEVPLWVYGAPAIGTFENGGFPSTDPGAIGWTEPHGEDGPRDPVVESEGQEDGQETS